MSEMSFRYFSAVEGRVVPRYGTPTYIGATRGASGYVINTAAVVAIPESEVARFPKEYRNAVQRGDLVAKTKVDHDEFIRARAAKRAPVTTKSAPADEQPKPSKGRGKDKADEPPTNPE